eukprot:819516-Karenia_brevis.AAC.1
MRHGENPGRDPVRPTADEARQAIEKEKQRLRGALEEAKKKGTTPWKEMYEDVRRSRAASSSKGGIDEE